MTQPPRWTGEQLEAARLNAIANFRRSRLEEPLEAYLEAFDTYTGVAEDLLETTVDLTQLETQALAILSDKKLLDAFRYLAGPPISLDDLKTLADAKKFSPSHFKKDPELVKRTVQTVLVGLDRRRFAWVVEGREPTEAERSAAVLASAALMANAKAGTDRRKEEKERQENAVEAALIEAGWTKTHTRVIKVSADAPPAGQFCRESSFGEKKADFVIGLWNGLKLPLECKVSNSSTNSVKRLNNEAAQKAVVWAHDFGATQVVPAAVLSGVYKLHNLQNAQNRGLTLFWAHDLKTFTDWIDSTKA